MNLPPAKSPPRINPHRMAVLRRRLKNTSNLLDVDSDVGIEVKTDSLDI